MSRMLKMTRRRLAQTAGAVALAMLIVPPALAQTNTANVRGNVGNVAAGGQVTARNLATGFTTTVPISATGDYIIAGIPPGSYELSAPGPNGQRLVRNIIIGVGESATFDFDAAASEAGATGADTDVPAGGVEGAAGEEVVVVGTRLIETKTSEVATNVSSEQIRTLPQTDRNFLAFTQLAPGVRYNDSETDRTFTSGASTASQVNVFIDGQSLKNNINDGGVAGQQNSRGNPFAQVAIQEFRVLTQNFKAEYEQAGAAVVTAVTRSGTNEFHGEVFGSFTDRSIAARNIFDIRADRPEPEFKRIQYGGGLGGPIIKDKLFFFAAYEGNDQDRAFNVIPGGTPERQAEVEASSGRRLSDFEGAFVSPFRADLFFGKLTFQPDDSNIVDLSANRRQETDIQGFGGTTSNEFAENRVNEVDSYNLRWSHRGDTFVNEASVDYVDYLFNPRSINPDLPTFDYGGVIVFGGRDATRRVNQKSLTFRNDTSLTGIEAGGSHSIKFGVKYAIQDFQFVDARNPQPRFFFNRDLNRGLDFSFPERALLGLGDPEVEADTYQLGLYAQDDWEVNDNLTLNLGLRWDFETDQFNNDYETPQRARELLLALPETSYFRGQDFVTDGDDRDPFYGAFQPRIGFSYDINADQRTVIFGGFGRYYDRNNFNNARDETFRDQYTVGNFFFSRDGLPRDGNPTVVFNPSFLTREGLIALQAQAQTGLPELFAVKNDARPPRTDQFSLGVRQRFGNGWLGTLTGSYIRGKNGFTNLFATRNPDGSCCDTALARSFGYANVLIGVDELDTRYYGLYATLEKPYTAASRYGVSLTYTLSKGEQNGNDLFSLDKPTPDDFGFRERAGSERHTLVVSGIVDLPLGFRLSTLSSFGTGAAFQVFDASNGFGVNDTEIRTAFPDDKNCLGFLARCEVNLTLEKDFGIFDDHTLGVAVDLFNAFNNKNFTGFEGFIPPEGNPNFGNPNALLTLPRRLQLRAFYRF